MKMTLLISSIRDDIFYKSNILKCKIDAYSCIRKLLYIRPETCQKETDASFHYCYQAYPYFHFPFDKHLLYFALLAVEASFHLQIKGSRDLEEAKDVKLCCQ